jgi:hypothetical protein
MVKWLDGPGFQRIPGSSPQSLHLHMFTSAARLVYQLKAECV